jgi:hypothetical protein
LRRTRPPSIPPDGIVPRDGTLNANRRDMNIEERVLDQLRSIQDEHRSRVASIDPGDPLAVNTAARHNAATRTLLQHLRSTVPIGSPVADEVEAAVRELPGAPLSPVA